MNCSKTIKSYRNKINKLNKIYSLIPKQNFNTDTNISPYKERQIYSYKDYKPNKIKYKNILNSEVLPINNNSNSLSNFDKGDFSNFSNNYILKTLSIKNKLKHLSLSCKKNKKFINYLSKYNNKSEKISLKIINDCFKPETDRNTSSRNTRINNKLFKKTNFSTQANKTNSTINNLSYYFPNLFNAPYNKISSPYKKLNTSRFFFKNLKELKYDENVKNLSLIKKNNMMNKAENLSKSKINKEKIGPIFIEKVYTINILKNLRFNFQNLVEKGKHKNFINSFYITRNLKFNNN